MGAFTLDTSGIVRVTDPATGLQTDWVWTLLTPFQQGYVAAALRSVHAAQCPENTHEADCAPRFTWLAPETLAAMLRDCEARLRQAPSADRGWGLHHSSIASQENGALFWRGRQRGERKNFPPVTLSLGDDGLVRQAVAS